jgi:hypothetical protein
MCYLLAYFYLESCAWPEPISRLIRHKNSIKYCANSEGVRRRPWQWLAKRSEKKYEPKTKKTNPTESKKGEIAELQS